MVGLYTGMLGDPIQAWETAKLCKDWRFLSLRPFIGGIQAKTPAGLWHLQPEGVGSTAPAAPSGGAQGAQLSRHTCASDLLHRLRGR